MNGCIILGQIAKPTRTVNFVDRLAFDSQTQITINSFLTAKRDVTHTLTLLRPCHTTMALLIIRKTTMAEGSLILGTL